MQSHFHKLNDGAYSSKTASRLNAFLILLGVYIYNGLLIQIKIFVDIIQIYTLHVNLMYKGPTETPITVQPSDSTDPQWHSTPA